MLHSQTGTKNGIVEWYQTFIFYERILVEGSNAKVTNTNL